MKRLSWILLLGLVAGVSRAEGPGDEVVVVYNSRVPESKEVAEYYAKRRQVPANQIFGFELSTGEDMSRQEFQGSLQKPLSRALEQKKLWRVRSQMVPATTNLPARVEWRIHNTKIRYVVLCYGVPLRIAPDAHLKESGIEAMQPDLRRNEAAVDSELALLPQLDQKPMVTGPWRSPFYGATNTSVFTPSNGILMVARLDGPTAAIARGLVDKAIEADTDGLWGRTYFDLRNISDPGYKVGDEWIRGAAEAFRRMGFETIVDENPGTFPPEFPMSHIAFYCGWYDGDVSGPFTRPQVEFMPGAFAYHLHSASATSLRNPTRNWVGPLLAKGATISMGSVTEPYLFGTPDLAVFASRLIYFGFSFGEAAYASQSMLSWQTTVVGDPLYRPFGKTPQSIQEKLLAKHSKLIEWADLRLVNLNLFSGVPSANTSATLEEAENLKQSAVLTEKLADLYSGQGKPASAARMYERALALNPSPQQRIRLRLALGEKLTALGRHQDALEDVAKILQENPDYPAPVEIYKKLLALAQTLGKEDGAAYYEKRLKELTPPPAPATNK